MREIHAATKQILMLWDNASYHKGAEVKEYLGQINDGLIHYQLSIIHYY